MRVAIIGGSGLYGLGRGKFVPKRAQTPYGSADLLIGQDEFSDLIFLPRHGPDHTLPPHVINYKANIKALQQEGVRRIMAGFAVGSLHQDIPPRSLVVLDQFIDFTGGRGATFFDGGDEGLVHTLVTHPFCAGLRTRFLELSEQMGIMAKSDGTYVCTKGPRFETAAEVRMFARLGGDVVGMTAVPEAQLARELELHYAGVALSINWAAGLEGSLEIVREGMDEIRSAMMELFLLALRTSTLPDCECEGSALVIHPPRTGLHRGKRR